MATFSGDVECWWMKELDFFRMPATTQSVCRNLAFLRYKNTPLGRLGTSSGLWGRAVVS